MDYIQTAFKVTLADDLMSAHLSCTDTYDPTKNTIKKADLLEFLKNNRVTYGLAEENIERIVAGAPQIEFPLLIASGLEKQDGTDGEIEYFLDCNPDVIRDDQWDFRKVMTIPCVTKDQKLATITLPTSGVDGVNISGSPVRAKEGKKHPTKAGKGVCFQERDLTFYALTDGQVSITKRNIQVHAVYEVNETLSMSTGNLDFIGSIIIRGNVPAGYTVKAAGDIKIFGIVEAATIIAGGSIFISEGLAGLSTGSLEAGENIHIGYINQGIASAGDTIFVESSVVHSECIARNNLFCQQGNIIGGSISVGQRIEAKDIGNRLNTETLLTFGVDNRIHEQQTQLKKERATLLDTLNKLTQLGEKLATTQLEMTPKMRVTLLRQRSSQLKVIEQIKTIDAALAETDACLGQTEEAELIINNTLYSNVIVSFCKYKRKINRDRKYVKMRLDDSEIVIIPLA